MKQTNTRLINEVNKLISNTLSTEGKVYLPNIGLLTIAVDEASGSRSLEHSNETLDRSIIDVIKDRGNCTSKQAKQIYEKWFAEVNQEGGVTIEGIGEIKGELFTQSEVIAEKLTKKSAPKEVEAEPAPAAPKRRITKPAPKSNKTAWVVAILLIIIAIAAIFVIASSGDKPTPPAPVESTEEVVVAEEVAVVEEVVAEPAPEVAKPLSASQQLAKTLSISNSPKRFRVVCGVFLNRINAGDLIKSIESSNSEVECRAYPRDEGYMITIFESENLHEAFNYLNTRGREICEAAWVYDQKSM